MKMESAKSMDELSRISIKLKVIIEIDGGLLLYNGADHYNALSYLAF